MALAVAKAAELAVNVKNQKSTPVTPKKNLFERRKGLGKNSS